MSIRLDAPRADAPPGAAPPGAAPPGAAPAAGPPDAGATAVARTRALRAAIAYGRVARALSASPHLLSRVVRSAATTADPVTRQAAVWAALGAYFAAADRRPAPAGEPASGAVVPARPPAPAGGARAASAAR
jgi:hypothetical protein